MLDRRGETGAKLGEDNGGWGSFHCKLKSQNCIVREERSGKKDIERMIEVVG